jgi:mono/diheme cytochrome c family protein
MKKLLSAKSVLIIVLLVFSCLIVWVLIPEEKIDYNSQVKPILNKHCISCHGGVKKNGGFSLLFEAEAKGKTNPELAIVQGHPDQE